MSSELLHGIWTALLLLVFIGIVLWAWSGRRKRRFEKAARMPLEDDAPRTHTTARKEPSAARTRSITREHDNG